MHLHCLGLAKGLKPWPKANYRSSGLRRGQLSASGQQLPGDELNPAGPILSLPLQTSPGLTIHPTPGLPSQHGGWGCGDWDQQQGSVLGWV